MVGVGGVFTAGARHQATGGTTPQRGAIFMNSAGTTGTSYVSVTNNSGWADSGPVDVSNAATYRPGGGSWVLTDFADEQTIFAACWNNGPASANADFTSMWGQIEYLSAGGMLVFLLQLAGLGALPFVGAMDFSQFLRYLSWRRLYHPRHTILTGDEVRRAWRELREYRAPCFFLPAL
jgi:hypothetical protein